MLQQMIQTNLSNNNSLFKFWFRLDFSEITCIKWILEVNGKTMKLQRISFKSGIHIGISIHLYSRYLTNNQNTQVKVLLMFMLLVGDLGSDLKISSKFESEFRLQKVPYGWGFKRHLATAIQGVDQKHKNLMGHYLDTDVMGCCFC